MQHLQSFSLRWEVQSKEGNNMVSYVHYNCWIALHLFCLQILVVKKTKPMANQISLPFCHFHDNDVYLSNVFYTIKSESTVQNIIQKVFCICNPNVYQKFAKKELNGWMDERVCHQLDTRKCLIKNSRRNQQTNDVKCTYNTITWT